LRIQRAASLRTVAFPHDPGLVSLTERLVRTSQVNFASTS